MKHLTEEEKEKISIEAKNKAYDDKELTEEEQDILYEQLQVLDRLMSCYSDGGPALPLWVSKLTKYYSSKPLDSGVDDISEFLKRNY